MRKRTWTLLLGLLLFTAGYGQVPVIDVSGHVMLVNNNQWLPVENQEVIILIDSTDSGFSFTGIVLTDENGYFSEEITLPWDMTFGMLHVLTFDSCLMLNQELIAPIFPGITLPEFNFYLCDAINPGCSAGFYWDVSPGDPMTYSFFDISSGSYNSIYWDFGDNYFSSEPNPVHTYGSPGVYSVCLTISDSTGFCWDMLCAAIIVGDSAGTGCMNFFYYTYDGDYTATFYGFTYDSLQIDVSYFWDFGDGTTDAGQTVTHSFQPNGVNMYNVCLTTVSADPANDSCIFTSCQPVYFNNFPECEAFFYYYPTDSAGFNIQFTDMSYTYNGPPDNWAWNFGDGATSFEQNPVHTYADTGYYEVCLVISDSMGDCEDSICQGIYVGFPGPSGCESYFYPMNMYGLTVEFEGYTVSPFPTEYTWEFGDGTTGTGNTVSHTYPAPGIYLVTLNTLDSTGCAFTTTVEVWVDNFPYGCEAYFYSEQTDSLTFSFTGEIYWNGMVYNGPASYNWDFGDGSTASGQTVTHTFPSDSLGMFYVCLETYAGDPSTGDSCMAYFCEEVYIVPPSFSIFGGVYLTQTMPADQAVVRLMSLDSTWTNVEEVATTTIDSGFYHFDNIPFYNFRLYFVQAELPETSAYYGQYLPTYHISALNWEDAQPVLPLYNWTADIFLIEGTSMNMGPGGITGYVVDLGSRGYMEDVEIILMGEDMTPYTYTRSNNLGWFGFEDLPYGTYVVHAEIMGIATNPATITLGEENETVTIEIQVDNGEANAVFGIGEKLVDLTGIGNVFPNPVSGNTRLKVNAEKQVKLTMKLINGAGQMVSNETVTVPDGSTYLPLPVQSLVPGVYHLQITSASGDFVTRRLVKFN